MVLCEVAIAFTNLTRVNETGLSINAQESRPHRRFLSFLSTPPKRPKPLAGRFRSPTKHAGWLRFQGYPKRISLGGAKGDPSPPACLSRERNEKPYQ